jgi:hypothetical protein
MKHNNKKAENGFFISRRADSAAIINEGIVKNSYPHL